MAEKKKIKFDNLYENPDTSLEDLVDYIPELYTTKAKKEREKEGVSVADKVKQIAREFFISKGRKDDQGGAIYQLGEGDKYEGFEREAEDLVFQIGYQMLGYVYKDKAHLKMQQDYFSKHPEEIKDFMHRHFGINAENLIENLKDAHGPSEIADLLDRQGKYAGTHFSQRHLRGTKYALSKVAKKGKNLDKLRGKIEGIASSKKYETTMSITHENAYDVLASLHDDPDESKYLTRPEGYEKSS
ncbi:MAG: hypothetical protein ABIE94_03225 [archaeon]